MSENPPYPAASRNNRLLTFYYFLEEGKLSPYLNWAESCTVPEDTVKLWACKYRQHVVETGIDTSFTTLFIPGKDAPQEDSTYFWNFFATMNKDSTIELQYSTLMVVRKDTIYRVECDLAWGFSFLTYDSLSKKLAERRVEIEKLKQFFSKASLPPRDPLPEEEQLRHKQAVEAFKCND